VIGPRLPENRKEFIVFPAPDEGKVTLGLVIRAGRNVPLVLVALTIKGVYVTSVVLKYN
jgi:hypothetical protein